MENKIDLFAGIIYGIAGTLLWFKVRETIEQKQLAKGRYP